MAFRISHTAVALCFALVVCSVVHAQIVLEDPDNFAVANIWSGPDELGVPGSLGGMLFSPDGNFLYIVGNAEDSDSAGAEPALRRQPAGGIRHHEIPMVKWEMSVQKEGVTI